ncbi:hypothetical protein ES703_31255 [subsurface metagenome]
MAANAGGSLHQKDFIAGVGDVQGRLNTGYPAANYQRLSGNRQFRPEYRLW